MSYRYAVTDEAAYIHKERETMKDTFIISDIKHELEELERQHAEMLKQADKMRALLKSMEEAASDLNYRIRGVTSLFDRLTGGEGTAA